MGWIVFSGYLIFGLLSGCWAFYQKGEFKVKDMPFMLLFTLFWPIMILVFWDEFVSTELFQTVLWKKKE